MFGQGTFQAVVSTDGTVTFAVYIYEDDSATIDDIQYYHVGFTAGDENAFLNIVGRSHEKTQANYTRDLQEISVFRIDGMIINISYRLAIIAAL